MNWYGKGQKSNAFVLSLEKRDENKTYVLTLLDNNHVKADQKVITKRLKTFYTFLYLVI